ncbi:MAG: di-trans,poly-cis-decaprenylcistransferase [Spirochaetales bacterium]|nr:di-trans,poly-cis-decaprenylcistransferase [Spirochaetales bacterium]
MPRFKRIPQHVAIILDGNGRWARARGLPRSAGHRAGGENLDRLLDTFLKLKIKVISLYAFSTENWKRPAEEIRAIWKLLNEFFDARLDRCLALGIQIRTSGDLRRLPAASRERIERVVKATAHNQKLIANFCVNYGSQAEILQAASRVLQKRLDLIRQGKGKAAGALIRAAELEKEFYTWPLPPVDLLVRPGGESRISNFLLWQSAYAEIYVSPVLWPDFHEQEVFTALAWYESRLRRFGGLNS